MSADEDTELRDLVAQTLETNGVLGKIRAQLRASVFLALEEQEQVKNKTPFLNKDLKKFVSTNEGRQVAGLVREFLQFFNLDYSLAVFDPESGCGEHVDGRENLSREFNIIESDETSKVPLLAEVLKRGTQSRGRLSSTEAPSIGTQDKSKKGSDSDSRSQPIKSPTREAKSPGLSDFDDDSFFDDPLPTEKKSFNSGDKKDTKASGIPKPGGGSGLSSLAGLPSLVPAEPKDSSEADIKQIDQNLADLGVDVPEDEYDDDDFESSNISPYGQTPRSARSTHDVKSIDEDDEIEEDLEVEGFKDSDGEDLLGSDISEGNDLTTDRTISPRDQSNAFDYIEDVIQH